jgi:hypothetical protein
LLHLSGAEEEFLQEAEVQPKVDEQWEEVENGFQNLQVENKLSKKVKNGLFLHFDARM